MVAFNITKWKILSSKLSKLDDELEPPCSRSARNKDTVNSQYHFPVYSGFEVRN